MTDAQRAAQEIYDTILVELLVSEPPDEWLRKTPEEIKARVRAVIDRHMC